MGKNHKMGGGFYSGQTNRDLSEIDDQYKERARKLVDSIMAGKRIANSNHIGSIVHRD